MSSYYNEESNVTTLLTRGGYRNSEKSKSDIMNAVRHYRGLHPKFDKFCFNDGAQKDLIFLSGTIPVPYKGANYNIPISIWVLDTHPYHAPLVFVCPTHDMQIRVSRHVDHTGKVYLPYLHEWNHANSDLLGLIQICIITFGEQPPVFAKPATSQPQMTQMPYPPPPQQQQQTPYPPTANAGYPGYPQSSQPPPPYPGYQPPGYPPTPPTSNPGASNSGSAEDDSQVAHMSLVSAVEDKIRRMLREEYSSKQGEIQSLKKTQDDLNANKDKISNYIRIMKEETAALDTNIKRIQGHKSQLEATLSNMSDNEEIPVDDLVTVSCPLFRQLLNAYSEDAATDDYIYYLGEALRQGVIDTEAYLKNTRNASRKQFEHRLTMQKCRERAGLEAP